MMDLEQFADTILNKIVNKADDKFHLSITTELKNNGIRLTGLSAVPKSSNGGPCVFLNEYYKEYMSGNMDINQITNKVFQQISNYQDDVMNIDIMEFMNWEKVRGRIYAKLVNAEKNKEFLQTVPHRQFLDLAVVYYMESVCIAGQYLGTIQICNRHMQMWRQNEEMISQAAFENMHLAGNTVFEHLENVFKRLMPEFSDIYAGTACPLCNGMYILTNKNKVYGASEILDQCTLMKISDKVNGDFIILPSSVHEVIILPKKAGLRYKDLAEMVQEINATEVSEDEFLSDHIYVYNRSKELLEIAA